MTLSCPLPLPQVADQVVRALARDKLCYLAVDGWTDAQHCSVLGTVAGNTQSPGYVVDLKRAEQAQDAEYLAKEIGRSIAELKERDIRVVSVVTDNANAMLKAGGSVAAAHHTLSLNCMAHSINLVFKDVMGLFQAQLGHCTETVLFFKNRSEARREYLAARDLLHGTMLKNSAETRWGTQWDMLDSLHSNKGVIQQAVAVLRGKGYELGASGQWWLYNNAWWVQASLCPLALMDPRIRPSSHQASPLGRDGELPFLSKALGLLGKCPEF